MFVWAATTEHRRLGGSTPDMYFLTVPEARCLRSEHGGVDLSCGLSLWLVDDCLLPVFHMVFPMYLSMSKSGFLVRDSSSVRLGLAFAASFQLHHSFKDPVSKYSHSFCGARGLGIQHMSGGDIIQPPTPSDDSSLSVCGLVAYLPVVSPPSDDKQRREERRRGQRGKTEVRLNRLKHTILWLNNHAIEQK